MRSVYPVNEVFEEWCHDASDLLKQGEPLPAAVLNLAIRAERGGYPVSNPLAVKPKVRDAVVDAHSAVIELTFTYARAALTQRAITKT